MPCYMSYGHSMSYTWWESLWEGFICTFKATIRREASNYARIYVELELHIPNSKEFNPQDKWAEIVQPIVVFLVMGIDLANQKYKLKSIT